MKAWVDTSYTVHPNMKIHTGGCISFGIGVHLAMSRTSCGRNSRHIDIRFCSKDTRVDTEGIEQMLADFFTTPLQGSSLDDSKPFTWDMLMMSVCTLLETPLSDNTHFASVEYYKWMLEKMIVSSISRPLKLVTMNAVRSGITLVKYRLRSICMELHTSLLILNIWMEDYNTWLSKENL